MRKKIGKRIGSVPIALVAVLALAAFISAGLWLAPETAQAQSAKPSANSIENVVLDVGEVTEDGQPLTLDVSSAFTIVQGDGLIEYAIASDQDDAADAVTDGIETASGGSATGEISIIGSVITFSPAATQPHAELADNTATITVTATVMLDSDAVATAQIKFDVTVVQNPIEMIGKEFTKPVGLADGACEVVSDGATDTMLSTRLGDHDNLATTAETDFDLTGETILLEDGDCLSADDSVEVSFTNKGVASRQ